MHRYHYSILTKIKSAFNHAAVHYDNFAHIQKEANQLLFDLMKQFSHTDFNSIIVDFGSGAGEMIINLFSDPHAYFSKLIEIDIASKALKCAYNKYSSLYSHHIYLDCQELKQKNLFF